MKLYWDIIQVWSFLYQTFSQYLTHKVVRWRPVQFPRYFAYFTTKKGLIIVVLFNIDIFHNISVFLFVPFTRRYGLLCRQTSRAVAFGQGFFFVLCSPLKNCWTTRKRKKKKNASLSISYHFGIGATIHIGWKIQCLLYAGFYVMIDKTAVKA